MRGVLPNVPGTNGQFVVCPTTYSVLGNCKSLRPSSHYSLEKPTPLLLQLLNATGTLYHHKMEMAAAPGLATQVSATSARTHTQPMRPRLMALRMRKPISSLLRADLHRLLGLLGSLSLGWPLLSLPSYDHLVSSSLPVTA